ncbi:hypothetical protein GIB67_001615 [Kingdonia uniflora]|uniref:Uncharacterized protein n=1 Tax=Kingdonia uniflora TaxID=39325 RepID=A0A7J7L0Q8_9MAGN|nr:hypothetical protein GIB67_001615 [Kingdonia uniflora]
METLTTSVSSLKVPGLPSQTALRELHLFRPSQPTYTSHQLLNKQKSSISNTHVSSSTSKTTFTSSLQTTPQTASPKPIVTHRKASTGYAAAMLDIARCNNVLDTIERDVRRFLRMLRNKDLQSLLTSSVVESKVKGEVVREIAEKGKFQKYLVALVKMLTEKNQAGMVKEVFEEFERIYDELSGTKVVMVSCSKKMEEDQLFGIAKRVQKMSGAMKVKVRHLINESLPSVAM